MKIGDNSIGSGAQESALVTSVLAAPKKTERLRKPERLFENFFWETARQAADFFQHRRDSGFSLRSSETKPTTRAAKKNHLSANTRASKKFLTKIFQQPANTSSPD